MAGCRPARPRGGPATWPTSRRRRRRSQKTTIAVGPSLLLEKVRKAKYDLDENEVKNYLQLEKLREGMFWVAGELFNFKPEPLLRTFPFITPTFASSRREEQDDRAHVGSGISDPYARPGKRSGAWMNAYRNQERFKGEVTTIVSNNANFVKPKEGDAVLISGPTPGTLPRVRPRPSTDSPLERHVSVVGHERRATTSSSRRSSSSTGVTHARGAQQVRPPLQDGRADAEGARRQIEKAATFNQGFNTKSEYLSAALIDMKPTSPALRTSTSTRSSATR